MKLCFHVEIRIMRRKDVMIKEILNDAKNLINVTINSDTKGMSETERKAYDMGIYNTLRAIETVGEIQTADAIN